MSELVPNIIVPVDEWLDLNTAAGVPIGYQMELINRGSFNILIEEAVTQPPLSSNGCAAITPIGGMLHFCTATTGSETIWVRSDSNYEGLINVQPI